VAFVAGPKQNRLAEMRASLLPSTASELRRLGLKPHEVALDGGFPLEASNHALSDSKVFIAGRQQPQARRSRRRLTFCRVGGEGRISHLKRS